MSPDKKRFFARPLIDGIKRAFAPEKPPEKLASPEDIAEFWNRLSEMMQDPRLQSHGPVFAGVPGFLFLEDGRGNDDYSAMRLYTEVDVNGQKRITGMQITTEFPCMAERRAQYSLAPTHQHNSAPIPEGTPIKIYIRETAEFMGTDGKTQGSVTGWAEEKPVTEKDLNRFKKYVEKAQFVDYNEEYIPGGLRYRARGV